jgi:hypothetical protein
MRIRARVAGGGLIQLQMSLALEDVRHRLVDAFGG